MSVISDTIEINYAKGATFKREIRRVPVQQTPEYNMRRHSLALLRSLIELYPKDAVDMVRQVALDRK